MRIALALALALLQDPAPDQEAGNVRFRLPDGWIRGDRPDKIVVLRPRELPQGQFATILVMPGDKLTGELRAWVETQWKSIVKGSTILEGGEVQVSRSMRGYDMAVVAAKTQDSEKKTGWLVFVAANPGDRVEPFLYVTDSEDLLRKHQETLAAFNRSLTYGNVAPPPPAAQPGALDNRLSPSFTWGRTERPKGNAGLDGVYASIVSEQRFDPSTYRTNRRARWKYWTFFPDGRFYGAMPDEGLESFNFEYLAKKNPAWFGRYELNGDEGTLVWNDDRKTTWAIVRTEKGPVINKVGPFVRLDPCDGLKLEGTYRRADWETLIGESRGSFITFARNGTFEDRGTLPLASVMWWRAETGSFFEDDGTPGKGTYRIGNYTLELIYADGRKRRVNFHLAPDATREKPATVVINTWFFVLGK